MLATLVAVSEEVPEEEMATGNGRDGGVDWRASAVSRGRLETGKGRVSFVDLPKAGRRRPEKRLLAIVIDGGLGQALRANQLGGLDSA